MNSFEPYEPLNVPKPFGDGVWIVDGPEIKMTYGPVTIPFPTRMVIARLEDNTLWIHSPITPDGGLFDKIDALGRVGHIVAPNSLHYWFMADWIDRYPSAKTYAVPDLYERAKRRFRIDHSLEEDTNLPWQGEIARLYFPGTVVSEAIFFVRGAKVLILTDLIENLEPKRVRSRYLRWLIKLVGGDGTAPYDMRLTYLPQLAKVRQQVGRMLEWPVEKVVMAHGKPYVFNARAELSRAFRWAMPKPA